MDYEAAAHSYMAILDVYGDRALVPCACAAGASRAKRWRNLPKEAEGVRLDSGRALPIQAAARAAIERFVAETRGFLVFMGGYGVGKTRMIYAALNHLADVGRYGRYVMMPDLILEFRDAARRGDDYGERLRRIMQAPILAIDELDKLRPTEFVAELVEQIFLARYQSRAILATIVGFNTDGQGRIPPFLMSRIKDDRFHFVDMGGQDLRPIASKLDPWERGEGER
jgi:DNA replication protein DnaC